MDKVTAHNVRGEDSFFYPESQRSIPEKLWQDVEEHLKRCVDEKFSLGQHHFDGDSKFLYSSIYNITRDEPFVETTAKYYDYKLSAGKMTLGDVSMYDPVTQCIKPMYPYEVELKKFNYACDVYVDFVFKVYAKEMYIIISNKMSRFVSQWLSGNLHSSSSSSKKNATDETDGIIESISKLLGDDNGEDDCSEVDDYTMDQSEDGNEEEENDIDDDNEEDSEEEEDQDEEDLGDDDDDDNASSSGKKKSHRSSSKNTRKKNNFESPSFVKRNKYDKKTLKDSHIPSFLSNGEIPLLRHKNLLTQSWYDFFIGKYETYCGGNNVEEEEKDEHSMNTVTLNNTLDSSSEQQQHSKKHDEQKSLDIEGDMRVGSSCRIVEDFVSFRINVGQALVMVNGSICNIKLSGGFVCHSDPDDIGAYYIVQGVKKIVESQFVVRGNHIYVHFGSSSTSFSQSATASQASNTESNATADSPIILQCDLRPINEGLCKNTSASHFYFVVDHPKIVRREMEKRMKFATIDAESFMYDSSPYGRSDQSSSIVNHTIPSSSNAKGYTGFGEKVTISFPNIKQTNFNLVCILFLMGCNSRMEMVRMIASSEIEILKQNDLIDDEGVLANPSLLKKGLDSNYVRQAYLFYNEVYSVIHNQGLFPSSDISSGDLHSYKEYNNNNVDENNNNMDISSVDKGVNKHPSSSNKKKNSNKSSVNKKVALYSNNDVFSRVQKYIDNTMMPLIGHVDMFSSSKKSHTSSSCVGVKQHQDISATEAEMIGNGLSKGDDGCDESNNEYMESSAWNKPNDFDRLYKESEIDGWSRTNALMHISMLLISKNKQTNTSSSNANTQKVSKSYDENAYDNEFKKVTSFTKRFCKSFIEEFLPHIGKSAHWRVISAKTVTISTIIRKMILVYLGYVPPDDVDKLNMKRSECPFHLMTRGYKASYTRGIHKLSKYAANSIQDNLLNTSKISPITGLPIPDLSKVNWSHIGYSSFDQSPFVDPMARGVISKNNTSVMDVSGSVKKHQHPNSTTRYEACRNVRHVRNKNGGKRLKGSAAQQLDPSQRYFICPARTANDNEAGNDVRMARGCRIRIGYDLNSLLSVVMWGSKEKNTKFFNHFERTHSHKDKAKCSSMGFPSCPFGSVAIQINGITVGFTRKPFDTMRALILTRESKLMPFDVSITWVGGPIGNNPSNPLISPFYNYIHISGDMGAMLSPYIDMKHIWKLPMIVAKFSSSRGVYPNIDVLPLLLNFSHLKKSSKDCGFSIMDMPFHESNVSGAGSLTPLFDALLEEGVIVYKDCEELSQHYACSSFRDFQSNSDYYMSKSHALYVKEKQIDFDRMNMEKSLFDLKYPQKSIVTLTNETFSTPLPLRYSKSYPGCDSDHTLLVISEEFVLGLTASVGTFSNHGDPCRFNYSTGMFSQSNSSVPLNRKWQRIGYSTSLLRPKKCLSPSSISKLLSVSETSSASVQTLTVFLSRYDNGEDAIGRTRASHGSFDVRHDLYYTTNGLMIPKEALNGIDDNGSNSNMMQGISSATSNSSNIIDNIKMTKKIHLPTKSLASNSHCFISPKNVTKCITMKSSDYSIIKSDGLPRIGSISKPNSAIISRVLSVGSENFYRDASIVNTSRMNSIIQSCIVIKQSHSGAASEVIVKTSKTRSQEVGDKASTPHGQKGVAGSMQVRYIVAYILGKGFRGVVPLLFRGTHGVPSRATAGEFVEIDHVDKCLSQGRILTVSQWGRDFDPLSDYNTVDYETFQNSNGIISDNDKSDGGVVGNDRSLDSYASHGKTVSSRRMVSPAKNVFGSFVMMNAKTGQKIKSRISGGYLQYRLQHHLSRETFNSRKLGAVDPRTKQPTEGGKKNGGGRSGPLEVLNQISHGAVDVSNQMLFSGSDPAFSDVCCKCGLLADYAPPSLLGAVMSTIESKIKYNSSSSPYSSHTQHYRHVGKLKAFNRMCFAIENGPIVISEDRKRVRSMLIECKDKNGLYGSLISPSGGYCSSCRVYDSVYTVKMPVIAPHALENFYMSDIAWRLIIDVHKLKGDMSETKSGLQNQMRRVKKSMTKMKTKTSIENDNMNVESSATMSKTNVFSKRRAHFK